MKQAPIIVFSYNRPTHLSKTLDALAQNEFASYSDLFIFCDGAKPNATEEQTRCIYDNRRVAKAATGFRSVQVIERDSNYGLANNIIDGVSSIIDKYGEVIVLEDDMLTSPYFLRYMNAALVFYKNRPGVMSICADRPPCNKMEIPDDYVYDVFACLRFYCYGWATWKDRWNKVDWSLDYLDVFLRHPEQISAFNRGGDDMTNMLIAQRDGIVNSWAIRFGFAHFKEHCVAILPCVPYVSNFGFDGTGVHCGVNQSNLYDNDLSLSVRDPRFLELLYEDARIINAFYNNYSRKKRPLWQKGCNYIARRLGKKPPFVIKSKVYK